MRPCLVATVVLISACGGGERTDPELTCDANLAPASLTADVQPILTAQCTSGCHLTGDSYADYTSAAQAKETVGKTSLFAGQSAALKVVDPTNLANSSMWLKLLGGQLKGRSGPKGENVGAAMPQGSMLSTAELTTIKRWICSGAK